MKPRLSAAALMLILGLACLTPTAVRAAGRDEGLSGEAEKIQQAVPGMKEPETGAGMPSQDRPALKLPEVVVTGDKTERLSPEKKDWLWITPLTNVKEIPGDSAQSGLPGLQAEKGLPGAETVTAKKSVISLETAGGNSELSEARLVAGREWSGINVLMKADHSSAAWPVAQKRVPYDQKASAGLDLGLTGLPGALVFLDLDGREENARQPEDSEDGWGAWLKSHSLQARLSASVQPAIQTQLRVSGTLGTFSQAGQMASGSTRTASSLTDRFFEIHAVLEQGLKGTGFPGDMDLWVEADLKGQVPGLDGPNAPLALDPEQWMHASVSTHVRPISVLYLEGGVRVDEFHGVKDKSVSAIQAKLSLVLPLQATLYGSVDGGLLWRPWPEWSYELPWQARPSLPRAQEIKGDYRLGWQQQWLPGLSTEAAWQRRNSRDRPAWTDANQSGIFTLANLDETREDELSVREEFQISGAWSQRMEYIRRTLEGNSGVPTLTPLEEWQVVLRWENRPWSLEATYHRLGPRYALPLESSPSLDGAQLLSCRANWEWQTNWNFFLQMDNILSYAWQEWPGYPGRGFSVLAGVRVQF